MSTTLQFPGRARTATATATPGMSREKLWLPVAIVLAALVAIASWMLLISPVRDATSGLTAQTGSVTAQADQLQQQVTQLQGEQADLPTYVAQLSAARAALPADTGLPTLLRTLQSLGGTTGTSVSALTATAPTLVNADGSAAASATPTAGSLYELPVTITAGGTAANLRVFLEKLQREQPRALLISDVHLAQGTDGLQLDVSATAFIQPAATNGGG